MNTETTQEVFKWLKIVLIVLAVFLGLQAFSAAKDIYQVSPAYNSISVTGTGDAVATPDIATFSFSISSDAKDVSTAQTNVNNKMNAVITALKNLGIAEKDIKTTDYSVYPKYTYENPTCPIGSYCPPGRQIPDGYTASQTVSVKVRNTADAGKALTAAGDNGATNISSLTFTQDDLDAAQNEARANAIANAKSKAETLAKQLGVRLVRVVSYTDNNQPTPYPVAYGMGGGTADMKSAPIIPTGQNKTTVMVTVTYEIR